MVFVLILNFWIEIAFIQKATLTLHAVVINKISPRLSLYSSAELMDTRTVRPFSLSFNTSDYRILHMDQDQGRLYLGSREYLVSLDMQNVNKEPLIVRRAGTCTYAHFHYLWLSFLSYSSCSLLRGLLRASDYGTPVYSKMKFSILVQIHWPAPSQRKGECQMTGKGNHVSPPLLVSASITL